MSAAAKLKMDDDGFYPVVSSNIESARYDISSKVITVRFKNGSAYEYPDCSSSLWTDFSRTFDGKKSPGSFMAQQLRPRQYVKIADWK